ncbi:MAG: FmdB family zinc ribbon protein, partial [Anaerolineales bacterium]
MPIFEYRCSKCQKRFETIVRGGAIPECPSCGSVRLEKLLSTFAVSGGGSGDGVQTGGSFGGCGTCGDPRGPGACSLDD